MGAWAEGPFDNDDAADFVGDLAEVTDADSIASALDEALDLPPDGEYVESPDMSTAIAAAAIVAIGCGADPGQNSYAPDASWLAVARPMSTADRRAAAAAVFRRAFEPTDNEWFDLWDEADALDDVRRAMHPFVIAVSG